MSELFLDQTKDSAEPLAKKPRTDDIPASSSTFAGGINLMITNGPVTSSSITSSQAISTMPTSDAGNQQNTVQLFIPQQTASTLSVIGTTTSQTATESGAPSTSSQQAVKSDINPPQINTTLATGNDSVLDIQLPNTGSGDASTEEKKESSVEPFGNATVDSLDTDPDFDMKAAMNWDENGVGSLPGSDLKFRLNEFGIMELITDDMDGIPTPTPEPMDDSSLGSSFGSVSTFDEQQHLTKIKPVAGSPGDESFCRCENCGINGLKSDFVKSGRFCSHSCVGQYASSKVYPSKKEQDANYIPVRRKKKPSVVMDTKEDNLKIRIRVKAETGESEELAQMPPVKKHHRSFNWSKYLEEEGAIEAPEKLFYNAFPKSKNPFRAGYKLEGIDPKHPSLYCVLSVAEVRGYRIRLHFDGYSECYDFWANADSEDVFPVGWCDKNNKVLQPPKGFTTETFNWNDYLKQTRSQPALKTCFTVFHNSTVTPHGFRAKMKLEAVDRKNTSLICVATVADVFFDNILIHFDGWEDSYDYWCKPSSPYIHPMGWCQENGRALSPPNDWKEVETFTWEKYLTETKSLAVAARAFKMRLPNSFEVGMKLEVVDKRNPILIRAATVIDREDHRILIHSDGWADCYDYWVDDDSPDIHPVGWCSKTGHPLQPPIGPRDLANSPSQGGCPTPGCNGIGHIKGAKYTGHHSAFGCPYSQLNMNKESALADRLSAGRGEYMTNSEGRPPKVTDYSPVSPLEPKGKCPTPGCDGIGHVTGKFTAHYRLSGCPLAAPEILPKPKLSPKDVNGETASPEPIKVPTRKGRPPGSKNKMIKPELGKRKYFHKHHIDNGHSPEKDASLHQGIHQSVFMPGTVPSPSKDLPVHWDHHAKLLPGVTGIRGSDVALWSIEQVAEFIHTLPGCGEQASVFQEQQIDGEAFLLLNQMDIVKIMNIKLGPALKIFNSILIFKNSLET